jgi:hypothetical protein
MEKHIRPAALRAKITKRIGWHTPRHMFGTWGLSKKPKSLIVRCTKLKHLFISHASSQGAGTNDLGCAPALKIHR